MKYLKQHPRITSLIIGFLMGLVLVVANDYWASATLSEYKELSILRESRYEELLQRSQEKSERLSKVNETLRQTIKTHKVTRPDGTIIEDTDTNTNTTRLTEIRVRKEVTTEFEHKLAEQREQHKETVRTLTNRKLRLDVGYTSDLEYYGYGSYGIWGPVNLGGGFTSGGTFLIGVGISL